MKLPVQITFRNMPPSDWIEAEIRKRARRLETYYDGIMGCRALVEMPHRHHRDGNRYRVRIDLTVPGEEIVVNHEATLRSALQDIDEEKLTKDAEVDPVRKYLEVAIREAFHAARRRLQDYARRQRGAVKVHETPPHGRVTRLFPDESYGFITASDGHEVYFHRRSVLDEAFERLEVGAEVAFVEEPGDQGPQASTVRLVGKHHYV